MSKATNYYTYRSALLHFNTCSKTKKTRCTALETLKNTKVNIIPQMSRRYVCDNADGDNYIYIDIALPSLSASSKGVEGVIDV